MDYIYAVIENGICVDVIYACGTITKANYIRIDAETAKTALYATYSGGVFTPAPPQEVVDVFQEVIAKGATLSAGKINLELPDYTTVQTGTLVKFEAPCTCQQVTGGLVIDGTTYTVCDAMGQCVTGKGGVWTSGAQVAVLIDKADGKAYIQNGRVTPEQIGAASKTEFDALAGSCPKIATGSYVGNGSSGEMGFTLTFPFEPKVVIIEVASGKNNETGTVRFAPNNSQIRTNYAVLIRGITYYSSMMESSSDRVGIQWLDNSIRITGGYSGQRLTESSCTYNYVVIG